MISAPGPSDPSCQSSGSTVKGYLCSQHLQQEVEPLFHSHSGDSETWQNHKREPERGVRDLKCAARASASASSSPPPPLSIHPQLSSYWTIIIITTTTTIIITASSLSSLLHQSQVPCSACSEDISKTAEVHFGHLFTEEHSYGKDRNKDQQFWQKDCERRLMFLPCAVTVLRHVEMHKCWFGEIK